MEALSGFEPLRHFPKLALTNFYLSVKDVGFHNQLNKEPLNTFLYTYKAQVPIDSHNNEEYNIFSHNNHL